VHHVHDGPVLNVRPGANPDDVHVAPDHDVHPDTALGSNRDVTDDLGTFVDVGGRVDHRPVVTIRPEHSDNYMGGEEGCGRQQGCSLLVACGPMPVACSQQWPVAGRWRPRSLAASQPRSLPMPPLDSFGRPLGALRISVTDRCNLRCHYCMPEDTYTWLPREDLLQFEEIVHLADVMASLGVDRVRLTGGEPLLRRDLDQLVTQLAARPWLRDLAMTTNGILLGEHAVALRAAG